MKKYIKVIIDILMFLLLIVMMGYQITNNFIHEILGTVIFILFIAHNALNFKWYMTIFKGKHDFKRNMHIIINLLLLISMFLTIISGILMSKSIYTFIHVKGVAFFSRTIHLIANAWTFVLVSIHLGLHLTPITMKIKNKIKNSDFEYGFYILTIGVILLGIYFFMQEGIWKDMFGITKFKHFDDEISPILFYLKYFVIAIVIAISTNFLMNIKIKKVKEVGDKE